LTAKSSSSPVADAREIRHPEDLRLARAVLSRDRKATAEFVARYSDVLYCYLRRRLIPRTDLADDFLQEVFLAAFENLDQFQGRSSLKAWLFGVARHKVEDHYRSRLREPEPLLDQHEEGAFGATIEAPIDELIDRRRSQKKTRRILEDLPELYSAVLLWRYWEKRSAAEMAAQSGRTVKAVERLLARARDQFRRRWNDE